MTWLHNGQVDSTIDYVFFAGKSIFRLVLYYFPAFPAFPAFPSNWPGLLQSFVLHDKEMEIKLLPILSIFINTTSFHKMKEWNANVFNEASKLYFMRHSCVAIILLIMGLFKGTLKVYFSYLKTLFYTATLSSLFYLF